jgi:hypothetical protein
MAGLLIFTETQSIISSMDKKILENTVLAILSETPGIGSLQLRKALIIADALHYTLHGNSITGIKYVKQRFGPVPELEAHRFINDMEQVNESIFVVEEPIGGVYTKNSYFPARGPDYSIFTQSQIDIIKFSTKTAVKYAAVDLSNMTHDENYHNTPMRGEIPLDCVCKMTVSGYETEPFTPDEIKAAKDFLDSDEAKEFNFI